MGTQGCGRPQPDKKPAWKRGGGTVTRVALVLVLAGPCHAMLANTRVLHQATT